MALIHHDKEIQLKELSHIVTGIRLFNRDCGKGGEGIDDCKLYNNSVKYCPILSTWYIEGCSSSY